MPVRSILNTTFSGTARLAEWSKAWDLSSHNRKIAWVRTPHLAWFHFNNWLQWRNRLAHGTYRQYEEICRGCEFEPHLEQDFCVPSFKKIMPKKVLPDRESNPGLPRDRRRSSPLDYRGTGENTSNQMTFYILHLFLKLTKTPSSRIWTSDLWISDFEQLQSTALPTELSKGWW